MVGVWGDLFFGFGGVEEGVFFVGGDVEGGGVGCDVSGQLGSILETISNAVGWKREVDAYL